ncbi:MAG TPA: CAP domain-containing protein [Nitrososphaerales archaeon]|nr:CAP domain-containing protein [Nitrososphaerales archaeon]
MKVGPFARRIRATQEQTVEAETKPPSHNGLWAALVVLLIIGAFVLFTPQGQAILGQGLQLLSQSSASSSSSSSSSTGDTSSTSVSTSCSVSTTVTTLAAPDIHGNQAPIWYPTDYCTLANYALSLINQDRATNGTSPVTLSFAQAAQQHVDSLLYYGYFSHNDTQGYKPYMRYSFLGGRGADFENVATEYNSRFTSTSDVETAIKDLENSMMNNDLTCCANLHKYNILAPLHTQVSIGIAYNSTTVYFGEEFENYYIALNFSTSGGCSLSGSCQVVLSGVPTDPSVTRHLYAVYVAYDGTPSPATTAELNSGPHEYGPGLLIGGVLPPCNELLGGCGAFTSGITVYATKWVNSSSQFDIEFSLHDFIQGQTTLSGTVPGHGAGVYTIYVVLGRSTNDAITSISVAVS